jgi:hypothetical protein
LQPSHSGEGFTDDLDPSGESGGGAVTHLTLTLATLLLSACANRRLPASYTIVPVKAASCEVVPLNDLQGFKSVEVRNTVEDSTGVHVRRVEFRKVGR